MSERFPPIAVIGTAGRFPGAADVGEYWDNLAAGRECLTTLTDDDLRAACVSPAELTDPSYVRRAGIVPDLDRFEPAFFGMTRREATVCDPQQRQFLELVHAAIEDAGHDPRGIGPDVAVFGASGPARYGDMNVLTDPAYSSAADLFGLSVLNNVDYLSTFVSYKLDFRGPSMAVLTACSSSVAALLMACRALQHDECSAAVAGAAHAVIPYRVGYRWFPGDVRSPDGWCRPFDSGATGTVFTSAAAAVLLKRLDDALADGDPVRGVIRGIGTTNDGSDKVSFSAPSQSGVSGAVVAAMTAAGVEPGDIDCVEMHATGTPMGDPIEVAALAAAYRSLGGAPDGSIPVGSVKSNIGHTAPVAGMAGLIKLVQALEHECLPPTVNVASVNPRLAIENTPLRIADTRMPWPRTSERPRRAGLTSMGIGGTNFHLVLEEPPLPRRTPHRDRPRIVVWSGRDTAAAEANRVALGKWFGQGDDEVFADAVATLQRGRTAHRVRGAAVCTGPTDAARVLSGSSPVLSGEAAAAPPPVVFTFPGQAAQHARMAAGLYGRHATFTETVDECLDLASQHGADVYPLWTAEDPGAGLTETANAQPLLLAVQYALARQWLDWGIRPAAVLGHSVGELAAATVAGVLDPADAMRLVVLRGRAMQAMDRGSMLVAATAADRLPDLLADLPGGVEVAAVNAARQVVLAGPDTEIDAAAAKLAADGVPTQRLTTSHAFHSASMRPAVAQFRAGFDGVMLRPPSVPLYSGATGRLLTDDEAQDPGFWAEQLVRPVLFADAVTAAVAGTAETAETAETAGIVLEVGPGRTLTGLVARHPAVAGIWQAVASLPRPDSRPDDDTDERTLLDAAAQLWLRGGAVDWPQLWHDEAPQRVSLPTYRFQRERFWVDPVTAAPPAAAVRDVAHAAEAGGPADSPEPGIGPFTVPVWTESAQLPPGRPPVPSTVLALVPAEAEAALPVVNALQQVGHRVVRVVPGTEPAELPGGFAVRPDRIGGDLAEVLDRLTAAGNPPTLLVHAWGTGPVSADELETSLFAFLGLVRTAAARPVQGRLPALCVVTAGAVDVSGGEDLVPARAALVAAARTAAMEAPGTVCRTIDIGPVGARAMRQGAGEDALVAELAADSGDRVVALRGPRRWLPGERAWTPPDAPPALRRGGVYVITGGLGGLGLAVAKGLAATGRRPRLALLARTARDVSEDVAEMVAAGSEVRVCVCDVADPMQVGKALDEVSEAFGPIDAVLHLAGVAGGGMLALRERADAERVLRPKVIGAEALAEALAVRPPVDAVVCFSSRAALTGMIGSGDYAAANAYLDAFAVSRPGWRSVNWPAWSGVGMAARGVFDTLTAAVGAAMNGVVPATPAVTTTTVAATTHWVLDEHRIGGVAVMPGTGLVDAVVRAVRNTDSTAAGAVVLREVTFLRPLVADDPHLLRVELTPTGDREWTVRVASRPSAGDTGDEEHLRCVAGFAIEPASSPADMHVAELTAGLPSVPPPSLLPAPGGDMALGPHWRCVRSLWESDTETVAELALPDPFAAEAGGHELHPALADIGTGLLRRRAPDELLVPVLYERAVFRAPLPATVYCRIRKRPGADLVADVVFVDPGGAVLAEIDGFRLRSPHSPRFGRDLPPPGAGAGLDTAEGVRLLLWLLGARAPAQVTVLPHRDGRPEAPTPVRAAETAHSDTAAGPEPAAVPQRRSGATGGGATGGADAGSLGPRLATLWQQVLGRSSAAADDDFFALGGDSLLGVTLVGQIRDVFGVELSIALLFESPTFGELVAVLVEQGAR